MKKTIFLVVPLLSMMWSCSDNEVPQNIQDVFAENYPNAASVIWEHEGTDFWEADFIQNTVNHSVTFNLKGDLIESEYRINGDELSLKIIESITLKYPDYLIDEVEHVENDLGVFFEVEIKKGNNELELLYSSDGEFIKAETEEAETDDDD